MSSFFPAVGGAQVTANNLGRYLIKQGHTVVIFVSPKFWRSLRKQSSEFPFKILPMLPVQQSALPRLGSIYLKLQDIYLGYMQNKYKFDVWQSFGTYPTGVSISHFTHPRGIPHVVRTIGYDIQKDESSAFKRTINHVPTTPSYFSTLWDICVRKSSKSSVMYDSYIPTWLLDTNCWFRQKRWGILWGCSIRFWNAQRSYF